MKEKKNINIEIGGRIKRAREAAGLTQDRFAELVQLGSKNVSAIERGVVGVSVSSVKRICEVLCISSDTLFFDLPESGNDTLLMVDRLQHLTPGQYAVARDILNRLIEGFSLKEE